LVGKTEVSGMELEGMERNGVKWSKIKFLSIKFVTHFSKSAFRPLVPGVSSLSCEPQD
jgi:hypothetical protein